MLAISIIGTGVKQGNISKMCQEVLNGLKSTGYETKTIYLSDLTINPCIGCFQCIGDTNCHMNDDFNKVYTQLESADVIVLGSPVYFGNVSGLMKNFFDRHNGNAMYNPKSMIDMQKLPLKKRTKFFLKTVSKNYRPKSAIQNKKIIKVIASNKPYFLLALTRELKTVKLAFSHYIKELNCKDKGTIFYYNSHMYPERITKILKKSYHLGRSININNR